MSSESSPSASVDSSDEVDDDSADDDDGSNEDEDEDREDEDGPPLVQLDRVRPAFVSCIRCSREI